MKLEKEFFRVYDTIFNYILVEYGLDALIKFWKSIAFVLLYDLKEKVVKKGLYGAYEYWNKVLTEEGAKFRITMYPETTTIQERTKLQLVITECPAIKHLNNPTCPEYCRHCGIMYPEVLEPLGFKYEWKRVGSGRCEIQVEKK